MGWNNLSTWLKGGIIGLCVYIVLFLIIIILAISASGTFLMLTLANPSGIMISPSIFFGLIIFIVIGALIGFIVGKFKGEKK